MADFLAVDNAFGQSILCLVSRGNAIIAELLRLKDFIPPIFRLETKQEQQKYGEILFDFNYFKNSDQWDKKIESNQRLQDIDEEFRENHSETLSRFYAVFESEHQYVLELNRLVEELEEGAHLQQSLESVMACEEGKQLMCEALYLYGVMLIVTETNFPGNVRERMLVSYYRYSTQKASSLHSSVDEQVVGRLRTDDLYHQMVAYPLPQHRSTALASQAAMLYVCLYFCPSVLHNQTASMRETVDKFFPDNWVISVYMGMVTNLVEAWEPFKAARSALANTLDSSNTKEIATKYSGRLQKVLPQTRQLLLEGALTEEVVLNHVAKIMSLIRECNVLLNQKEEKWKKFRQESVERMQELSEVFSGSKPLTRVEKNESLQKWFEEIAKQISMLNHEEVASSGRKIVQLVQALEEVQEFHQLESQLQVRQFLEDTRNFLKQMLQANNVREDWLVTLQMIADLSYAWHTIDSLTPLMQQGIKKDPTLVSKLRATFLKLSSALETPLLRINLAHSDDLVSVSQFYSGELVAYVSKVLHIIPETAFTLLARIIALQTGVLKELPTRLDKDRLKEYAQLDTRLEVAKLTHSVSVFAEGILAMKTTLVGIIRIDPKQLLEDGIRREIVKHVANALHTGLCFNPKAKQIELVSKLESLGQVMDGYRRSFEYIQDYVNIHGLKIWQEEVSRIIAYNVEQECNSFARHKVQDWQSAYQSRSIPIPRFPPTDPTSVTFMGRLTRELIRVTDPKTTIYVEHMQAWYDPKTKAEILDTKFFNTMFNSLCTFGLTGVDRLLGFMIVTELQNLFNFVQKDLLNDKTQLEIFANIAKSLSPNSNLIMLPNQVYPQLIAKISRVSSVMLESVLKVGHMQLLRIHLAAQLRVSCHFNAKEITLALKGMNLAVLSEIKARYQDPTKKSYPSEDSALLPELATYLDWTGESEPLSKIYVTTRRMNYLSLLMFLFSMAQLNKLQYSKQTTSLVCKQGGLDGPALTVGIYTVLHQFHPEVLKQSSMKTNKYPPELTNSVVFLERLAHLADLPRSALNIPDAVMDHHLLAASTNS
ncbi:hypothetical protein B566_EDAN003893 [Ephemera danica]|nr:hypothetical protein B566_EDAN003893 [Ephemera danica]